MKRHALMLLVAAVAVVSLVAVGCTPQAPTTTTTPSPSPSSTPTATPSTPSQASGEVTTWKGQMAWNLKEPFEHFNNAGYTGGTANGPVWAAWLKEATNGRLNIELEPAGSVVSEAELLSAVEEGVLDCVCPANPGMYTGIMPEANIMMGPPFAIQTVTECWDWLYNFGMYDEFVKIFAKHNIYPIFCSSCMIANFGANFPLDDPEAVRGKNVRCSGSIAGVVKLLGGNPVMMAWTDVYEAMRLGTIDMYQGGFGALTTQHLDEVTDYFLIEPNMTTFTNIAMINLDKLNALPDDVKNTLMRDSKYVFGCWNMSMWQESEYEKAILAERMTLQRWSKEDTDRIVKETIETVWPEIAAISPECARLIDMTTEWAETYHKV